MKAYKVVISTSDAKGADHLMSCLVRGQYAVEYIPGVPAVPVDPACPLFVFKDFERAAAFTATWQEVWECEVDSLTPAPVYVGWVEGATALSPEVMEDVWLHRFSPSARIHPIDGWLRWIAGKKYYTANQVTLIRCLND